MRLQPLVWLVSETIVYQMIRLTLFVESHYDNDGQTTYPIDVVTIVQVSACG